MSLLPFSLVRRAAILLYRAVQQRLRHWTKPGNHTLILNLITDTTRSKPELVVENALLRQQLIVLKRQVNRPALNQQDRLLLVLLASKLRYWKQSLFIVQPDTLLRWPLPSEGSEHAALVAGLLASGSVPLALETPIQAQEPRWQACAGRIILSAQQSIDLS